MSINFDSAFGLHEKALLYRGERSAVLANNIANADTPNFKAKDLDFKSALEFQAMSSAKNLERTNRSHLWASNGINSSLPQLFEVPTQPNLDGNTVETQVEQAKFAQNALEFQASLTLLNGKMRSLMSAIRGE